MTHTFVESLFKKKQNMKKLILGLAIVAFLGSSSVAFATISNNTETVQQVQDGKKKTTATKKATTDKKEGCEGETKATKKDCGDATKSKDCCSHGKTTKAKTTSPEKK